MSNIVDESQKKDRASKNKGEWGETLATHFLCGKNYELVERNYHSIYGEIDIIVSDDAFIVFVEVKARKSKSMYKPKEAVTISKQGKIIKTAMIFLSDHQNDAYSSLQPRFDVVEIVSLKPASDESVEDGDVKINHIISAFETEDIYEF